MVTKEPQQGWLAQLGGYFAKMKIRFSLFPELGNTGKIRKHPKGSSTHKGEKLSLTLTCTFEKDLRERKMK